MQTLDFLCAWIDVTIKLNNPLAVLARCQVVRKVCVRNRTSCGEQTGECQKNLQHELRQHWHPRNILIKKRKFSWHDVC